MNSRRYTPQQLVRMTLVVLIGFCFAILAATATMGVVAESICRPDSYDCNGADSANIFIVMIGFIVGGGIGILFVAVFSMGGYFRRHDDQLDMETDAREEQTPNLITPERSGLGELHSYGDDDAVSKP